VAGAAVAEVGLQVADDQTVLGLTDIERPSVRSHPEPEFVPGLRVAVDGVEAGAAGYDACGVR